MARTALAISIAPGTNPSAGVNVTFTAADAANDNSFVFTGRELLLVRNVHATLAKTYTINSSANQKRRTGDITAVSMAAGVYHVLGPFRDKDGWQQTGGVIHLEGEDSSIQFAVIVLPLT